MAKRLAGLLMMLVGFGIMLASFYADDLGWGKYGGIGKDQFMVTGFGALGCMVGMVFLFGPSRGPR